MIPEITRPIVSRTAVPTNSVLLQFILIDFKSIYFPLFEILSDKWHKITNFSVFYLIISKSEKGRKQKTKGIEFFWNIRYTVHRMKNLSVKERSVLWNSKKQI